MVYRWLWLITRSIVDYNELFQKKEFDLEISSHKILLNMEMLEQVNYIAKERFGWVNASYQYGLSNFE
jgi:alpha,alpha-trehalase